MQAPPTGRLAATAAQLPPHQPLRGDPETGGLALVRASPLLRERGRKGDMKPASDSVTAHQLGANASVGAFSVTLGSFRPRSIRRTIFESLFQSLPPSDREWLSARAKRDDAPAPGLGGVSKAQISRLDDATREWLSWRFGEDA